MATKIAEFFVEIGVIGDLQKLDKVENSFKKLYGMAALNAKTLNKTLPGLAKISKGIAETQKETEKAVKKSVPYFEKMVKNLARNTTKVNKGIQAIEMTASSVGLELGSWPAMIGVGVLALGGMYYALDKITKKASQLYINTRNIALQTGLNREKLLQWQQAAQIANPNMDPSQVLQSISAIQKGIAAIRLGMGNVKPYQLLGMSIVDQDAFGVLEQLRKKSKEFQGDKRAWFSLLAQQIGVTPDMINVLRMSDKEFQRFKNIPLVSKENQEELIRLRTNFKMLNIEMGYFSSNLLADVAPALISIGKILGDMIRQTTKIAKFFREVNPFGPIPISKTASGLSGFLSKEASNYSESLRKSFDKVHNVIFGTSHFSPFDSFRRNSTSVQHHATINNTFNVTGEGGEEIANSISNLIQPTYEAAYSQSNTGPKSS